MSAILPELGVPVVSVDEETLQGVVTAVGKLSVQLGDILVLRFNPLHAGITAASIQAYVKAIFNATKGRVSTIVVLPQGLSVEKIDAAVRGVVLDELEKLMTRLERSGKITSVADLFAEARKRVSPDAGA
ncbi:hypothetical protein DRQ05_05690 [bacterium]|nr:MAG: hypothetical protein DRQ05_05690 [bacterium]